MIRVRIEAAQEGMVLARDILDASGGVLVRQGTALTKPVLDRVREAGGVDEVFVAPAPLSDPEKDARRREIEAKARRMFDEHASDPLMQELARVSAEILGRRV